MSMTTSRKRFAVAVAAASALGMGVATTASASATGPNEGVGSKVTNFNVLRFYNSGDALSAFTTRDDSPADTNRKAIVNTVPAGGAYSFVYSNHSAKGKDGVPGPGLNIPVGNLKNVSLDFDSSRDYGGGFRINVVLQDANGVASGTSATVFASPINCVGSPYGTSTWKRSDFTGVTAAGACSINDQAGNTYTSDGTRNAFQVYQAANPTANKVAQVYVINDGAGTYVFDRVALGTNFLYNNSGTTAINCKLSEAMC
jgi:hypothetical protein